MNVGVPHLFKTKPEKVGFLQKRQSQNRCMALELSHAPSRLGDSLGLLERHRSWWLGDVPQQSQIQQSEGSSFLQYPERPDDGDTPFLSLFPAFSVINNQLVSAGSVASIIASRSPGSSFAREESGTLLRMRISSQAGASLVQARTISGATGRRSSSCTARGITILPYILGRISISWMRRR